MATYATDSKTDMLALVERAKRCFRLATEAESKQRKREKEDLEFQIPENQWSEAAKRERQGDGVTTPVRPMVSINLLQQPQALVEGQFAKAHIGVNLRPIAETSNKELAEVVQDLYRRIERDGKAGQARSWAFARAAKAGRGWYRINTKYDEDSDPSGPGAWDQEITFERLLYQENVYPDPAATKPDFSDAEWFLYVSWMDEKRFLREFPDAQLVGEDLSLVNEEQEGPEWTKVKADGTKAHLVAEYWWRDIAVQVIQDPTNPKRTRTRERVTVNYCTLSGGQVLREPQEWNGQYIPFIPAIGRELVPIDGERIWEGMTRPARDAQKGYNFAISTALEDMGRLSKSPYVGPVGSFETDEAKWKTINVKNWPYVEYDVKNVDGNPAPAPQPMQIDGTKLQLSLQMAEQFKGMVQATTAVYAPSLGEMPQKREAQSGRAILALQSQSDAGTSVYVDSMETITLPYEAIVVLDLIPTIYDRPGRVTQLLGGEDESRAVMLNAPFVTDPQTGQPVAAKPGDRSAKTYDLRKAKFGVAVDIGKSYQTRLEAGNAFMSGIVEADPQQMLVMGDLFWQFQDTPGSPEMAERYKRLIQMQHPGLIDDGEGEESPEALKAKAVAMQGQIQQMQQQLQQAGQMIQTKQVEQQAKVQVAQMQAELQAQVEQAKMQSELEIARMNNAAKIEIARIGAAKDALNAQASAQEELLSTGIKVQAEAEQTAVQHEHEHRLAHQEMAHEVGMAAAGAHKVEMSRTSGQDNQREEGQERSSGISDTPAEEGAET